KESSFLVTAERGASFALEFLFTAAEFMQALERDSTKFAARPGQRVVHVAHGNRIFLRELVVGNLVMVFEVVSLEQMKRTLAPAGQAKLVQVLDCQSEQAPKPFFFKEFVERFRRNNPGGIHHRIAQFLLGGGKIEGHVRDVSAALLATVGFVLVRNKTVHANAQIGSQAGLLWLELFEQFALEHPDKKSLSQ